MLHKSFRPEGLNAGPVVYTLPPLPGTPPSRKPAVRIFIGSEPGQIRAERVLVWSIMRHRDPTRAYELHLMRDLAGFRRVGWVTGFTNYRYAIPHFAGFAGRAIYNDVDQVYLEDPARLFDLEMDGHGFLAVANRTRRRWSFDTSVSLIDCARMAPIWTLHRAQTLAVDQLMDLTNAAEGLRGDLPAAWNARDGEYRAGESKVLHFTKLPAQPWRPFPRQYRYAKRAEGAVWRELEREADAAGFLWPTEGAHGGRVEWPLRISAEGPAPIAAAIGDLMEYRPWIYFADLTVSAAVGYFACWKYFTVEDYTAEQLFWFIVAGLALFRAGVFVNEIAHIPEGRMRAFKAYWNLICGIPLLTPSFMYQPARPTDQEELARRQAAGLNSPPEDDPTPRSLGSQALKVLAVPLLGVLRFMLLSPLLFLNPRHQGWIMARLTVYFPGLKHSEVLGHDLAPTVGWRRSIAELCCFGVMMFVIFAYSDDIVPWSTFTELYALSVFAVALHCLRALFSRRRRARASLDQGMTVEGPAVLDALILPLGSRYQALRETVPTVPYHNLGAAHRRLIAGLPADSAYRRGVRGLGAALRVATGTARKSRA
ncbi:MAG TPA: hypothetical protein VHA35_03745 [Dongiaceae bacterium]|nr:hypothetical protein [Dongiaceae bacterium]